MSAALQQSLKALGVTPWQFMLGVACIGSWWATVQPLPGQLERLNIAVQELSTKVEIHAVLLANITEIKAEVRQMRGELSTIEGKLAHAPDYRGKDNTP